MKKLLFLIFFLPTVAFSYPWAHRYAPEQASQNIVVDVNSPFTVSVEWGEGDWDASEGSMFGYGLTTDGTGWTWVDIYWFQDGDGSNKRCKTSLSISTPGKYYYAYRMKKASNGGTSYSFGISDWAENSGSLNAYSTIIVGNVSKADGLWSDGSTWEGNTAPTSTSHVAISHQVTVSSTATAGSVYIYPGKSLTVSSGSSLTVNGALNNTATASGVVVQSGGSLITNGSVSGSAQVKRDISANNQWHMLSSPVAGQNICDGTFAPLAANFNATTGVTYDFYRWSEEQVSGNLNWLNLKNSDWSLNTADFGTTPQFGLATGYLVAYDPAFTGSSTKEFSGVLNTGDQVVALGVSGNTWNLIGNPFSSAIDWDLVTKTNLDGGYYYVYNENKAGGAGYESYLDASHKTAGANGKISSTQGFFVKASGSSLTLPNAARVHDNNWMKTVSNSVGNLLKITLANAGHFDETQIIFEESGNADKDFYDADKLLSIDVTLPQLYTLTNDGVNVNINSMPFNIAGFSVPLGSYIPSDGEYSISMDGLESFPMTPGIVLEDMKTNTLYDFTQPGAYTFQAEANEQPDRFILHFAGVTGMNENVSMGFITSSTDGWLTIKALQSWSGDVKVTDLGGRILNTGSLKSGDELKLNMSSFHGLCLVYLISEKGISTQKVIVK